MSNAINKTLQLNNMVLVYRCDYNNIYNNKNRLCISIVALYKDDLEQCTDIGITYDGLFNDDEFYVSCDDIDDVRNIITNYLQQYRVHLELTSTITDASILKAVEQALATDINAWVSM